MAGPEVDRLTGTATTGHEWDGIKELNTPLPKWWLYVFYFTIAISIVYCVFYPSWPLPGGGYARGILSETTRQSFQEQKAQLQVDRSVWETQMASLSVDQIAQHPELSQIAAIGGKAVFDNNCAACHGSGGLGRPGGYPVLLDDDWIWGGTLDEIQTTVTHGIRNVTDADARQSQMPAYGADGVLTTAQISAVADHVLALRGLGPDSAEGANVFEENCAACHGELGKGIAELGAPNLTDQIWLYGSSKQDIVQQIYRPRQGVMPPWMGRLTDTQIKQVAIYVHNLGGGQ